jgi:hypothetical protein
MKISHLAFSALLVLGTHAYAGHDKASCTCDDKCQENCAEGKGEACECKTCDCAKTGKCDHGKCEHHHKHDGHGHDKKKAVKATKKTDTKEEANTNPEAPKE